MDYPLPVHKLKAVVFDIDGTLTPDNSWTAFTRDIGASVDDHVTIYRDHVSGKIGLNESKRLLLNMWQATGNARKEHIQQIYERWPIRAGAQELISWLSSRGILSCLITGSVGIYAKHIGQRLGVESYYANAELHFDNGGALVDFDYTTDQASRKATQLDDFCRRHRLTAQECVAVGDSDNDIKLFTKTGRGNLIDHDEVSDELRHSAWASVETLSDIRKLVAELVE